MEDKAAKFACITEF